METIKRNIQVRTFTTLAVFSLIFLFFNWNLVVEPEKGTAKAATNLITGGSFENSINDNWTLWTGTDSTRDYEVYRTLDVPYGFGSYAASIEVGGSPENRWYAGFATNNSFALEANMDYYYVFYAKASTDLTISTYLEDAGTYSAITPIVDEVISTQWTRHTILFSPTQGGNAVLTFTIGDMPNGAILSLDGIQIYKADIVITTTEVKGYIGNNKAIRISNVEVFDAADIEVELPYFDNETLTQSRNRYNPTSVTSRGIYIDIPAGTFAGVGGVYVNGNHVGDFTYNVLAKITEIHPTMPRADEDLTIIGTGFHPGITEEKTYVVLKTIGLDGKSYEYWAQPHTIDSTLTQVTVSTPLGIMASKLYVQTAFLNMNSESVVNKSNSLSYKVKPIVYSAAWSQRGFEQVGDKLRIRGKGISHRPTVTYYDMEGNKIDSKRAKLIEVSDVEYIEVESTKKANHFRIAVTSNGVESDEADIIDYSAKPRLNLVKGKYSRTVQSSKEKIYASKIGDTITLTGVSLKSDHTFVEFQGPDNTRLRIAIDPENISKSGSSLTVVVPVGAMNGHVGIEVNGEMSNYLPLELVPTVESYIPDPIEAGVGVTITTTGVGENANLTSVTFKTKRDGEETIIPEAVWYSDGKTYVYLIAPKTISNANTALTVTYDRWSSDGKATLNARPNIKSASINMDSKILTIKGYGFSISSKANQIAYMYADTGHTVITPNVKVLGVYPTEEGQEIRIKINDNYHYGYVTVTVDGYTSNEMQFGPVFVSKIARRVEYVEADSRVRGVLYISGYNFGEGGVMVGDVWADIHYRNDFFIIAVVDEQYLYEPVIVARQ